MNELVLGARLDADAGSLVGQLSRSQIEARGLEGAFEDAGEAARRLDQAVDGAGRAIDAATGKTRAYDAALDNAGSAARSAVVGAEQLSAAQARSSAAAALNAGSARQQGAAYQQLGFQMQDVFQQVALGVNPMVILAQQGGQTASAIALMGERADGTRSRMVQFATFLSGPYGAALFGAVTIGGFLIQSLLDTEDAAEGAEFATYKFGDAQSIIADVIDINTGKIKEQSEALWALARAQIAAGRVEAQRAQSDARAEMVGIRKGSVELRGGFGGGFSVERVGDATADVVSAFQDGSMSLRETERSLRSLLDTGLVTEEQYLRAAEAVTKFGVAAENIRVFEDAQAALEGDREALAGFLEPNKRRTRSGSAAADRLGRFGESAGEKVQRILGDYDAAPRGIDKAMQDLRTLDRLMVELEKRRPPNFETTIASAQQARQAVLDGLGDPIDQIAERFSQVPRDLAEAQVAMADLDAIAARLTEAQPPNLDQLLAQLDDARDAVRDSLVRPFEDLLRSQRQSIDYLQLAAQGRHEEAAQLELIHSLMRQVGAESEAQLAIELAKRGVTAEMLEQMLQNIRLEDQLAIAAQRRMDVQRAHLQEVDYFQGTIERFFADIPRKGLAALGDFASGVQDQVSDYFARYLTEALFGGAFRQLEDQLSGQAQVIEANEAYVGKIGEVVDALRDLESAANGAAAAQRGEIVVYGDRGEAGDDATDPFDFRIKSPRELFGDMAKGLLKELGLSDLADTIGDKIGIALEGTAYGSAASSLVLGSSGNQTTAAIGGALGQVAGDALSKTIGGTLGKFLGPLGGIAGGLLGGLVGGLFSKADYGTASLSGPDSMSISSRGDGRASGASSLGGSVTSALDQIAEALDAELGAFQVSIGTYKDKFRVSTRGSTGKLGGYKGSESENERRYGLYNFGDDEAAAIAFAIGDAIGDGAIKGVSEAVQRALRSSDDINEALEEALKVREVEDILSGIADDYQRELRAFEKVAEERLRIGREYGFDLVELEKHNAEERADLIDGILQSRVGSLRSLLEDLSFGDLAEGTLAERRQKLLSEIAEAEKGAEAGDDGAADRLAALQRQLIDLSREAYGTAGDEYGADRDQAVASAERIIELEEERLKASQAELTERLDQGNALANETNDLLAEINANLKRLGFAGLASGGLGRGTINTQRGPLE